MPEIKDPVARRLAEELIGSRRLSESDLITAAANPKVNLRVYLQARMDGDNHRAAMEKAK